MTSLRKAAFLALDSISVMSSLGHEIPSGTPGKPAPEPTSASVPSKILHQLGDEQRLAKVALDNPFDVPDRRQIDARIPTDQQRIVPGKMSELIRVKFEPNCFKD